MSSINVVSSGEQMTYESVDANLAAGVLVIPSTTATSDPSLQGVAVAGAGAKNVLGVSSHSTVTNANQAAAQNGTDQGYPVLDVSVPDALVTVYNYKIVPVTYTAVAVAYGAKLKSAAAGAVAAWVDGTDDPAMIVGKCMQPGGVTSAGGVALAFIGA